MLMTDDEIRVYVEGRIKALTDGMVDIARLPQAEPEAGTTLPVWHCLPFVKDERLVGAPVARLGPGEDGALTIAEIDEATKY